MKKYFPLFLLTFLLGGCDIPGLISAYYAKEYCSCHFVMKQDESYCHEHASQVIPISHKEVDELKQTVTAKALGYEYVAAYMGEQEGCLLNP